MMTKCKTPHGKITIGEEKATWHFSIFQSLSNQAPGCPPTTLQMAVSHHHLPLSSTSPFLLSCAPPHHHHSAFSSASDPPPTPLSSSPSDPSVPSPGAMLLSQRGQETDHPSQRHYYPTEPEVVLEPQE
ncbi:hypothetical protein CK203_059899 [Vitis vinifera]|uniref:Uncharacterized protein n=1 Tax=Vitis vinifera TaxID=29760 RepID=A0A438GNT8_VITVI|nr:hypothetical protein CK203_059899 [Vitis vinifera]